MLKDASFIQDFTRFNPLSAEFFFTENNFLQPIFKQFCKLNLLLYTLTMYITFVAHM